MRQARRRVSKAARVVAFQHQQTPAPERSTLTATGQPRVIFRRAIDNGNLIVAEATARELGRLTLVEALELTALYAKRDPPRYARVAARWLQRWLEEVPAPTLEDAALVVGALGALGGRRHAEAMAVLFAATGP